MKTRNLAICGLFAAMTAILSQISIPFPGGVPLTLQLLAVSLSGIVLGSKKGFISISVYIILGAIGLPVYAGFSGGFQNIVGPTGGFLITFPIVTFIVGFVSEKTSNTFLIFLSTILGIIVNYTVGTLVFSAVTGSSIAISLTYCVIPFIFTDLIKSLLATIIGVKLKRNYSVKQILSY